MKYYTALRITQQRQRASPNLIACLVFHPPSAHTRSPRGTPSLFTTPPPQARPSCRSSSLLRSMLRSRCFSSSAISSYSASNSSFCFCSRAAFFFAS